MPPTSGSSIITTPHDRLKTQESNCGSLGLAAGPVLPRWNRPGPTSFNFLVNDLYPEILELEPEYWPALYESGLLYLEKYNKADARVANLKAALALNPKAAEVHAALAAPGLLQSYELDAARRELDLALEVNPKLIDALCYRGDSHLANFQAADAIKVLEEARKLEPGFAKRTLGRLAASLRRGRRHQRRSQGNSFTAS